MHRSFYDRTRRRVREAAKQFGYQPSHIARALQGKRTMTIGVLLPELGEGYHSQVLNGAADVLMRDGYFFFTAHHRHRVDLRNARSRSHLKGRSCLTLMEAPSRAVRGHMDEERCL